MKAALSIMACMGFFLFYSQRTSAQIKGDPSFTPPGELPPLTKSSQRISAELQQVYDNTPNARRIPVPWIKPSTPGNGLDKYVQLVGDKIVVDITVKNDINGTKAALQKLGLVVTGTYGRVISGLIPVEALPSLNAVSSIQFARPAYKPMHQSVYKNKSVQGGFDKKPAANPVISQGDTAQLSYLARANYKVDGKNIKIGILSDSYNNLGTAPVGIDAGELPGKDNPQKFKKAVDVLQDLPSGGTDEGRAMAEILHDVAPASELCFHTAMLGQANFAQGIQNLATTGCNIIVDDILYFAEPFFQDGIIAQSVDQAKKNGVTYFSSAGNQSNRSYESVYRSSTAEVLGTGRGTAHNFSAGGDFPRYYQPIFIPTGGSMLASLQWDQPFFSAGGEGTGSDLDAYLFDAGGTLVAAAATDNITSGDPLELLGYTNTTSNNTFLLVILKASGPDPGFLKYNMFYDAQFYITTPAIPGVLSPTLVGHAKAEGAIATAAANYLNTASYGLTTPPIVEFFSSLGGVPNFFDAAGNRIAPLVRKKPEITAPDGVNTSFFDPFGNGDSPQDNDNLPNFYGTSAAAPHAAGVAALMLDAQKKKTLNPAQIKGILEANAIDMDNIYTPDFDKGFDFNTGYGFIRADLAVGEVRFPNLYVQDLKIDAVCSDNPSLTRNWKITNPNPFDMETNWVLLGTSQRGNITVPPGESYFSTKLAVSSYFQLPGVAVLSWDDNFGFTRLDLANSSNLACNNVSARATTTTNPDGSGLAKPMFADVFPNPATTTFRVYLALADQQPVELQLLSMDGRLLLRQHLSQSKGIVSIDASRYRPGIYLLNIRQGTFVKTVRLVKGS